MRFALKGILSRRILLLCLLASWPIAVSLGQVRIVQTNSRGENIHLIDPVTNTVVGEITGIPINHGVTAAPDGSRLYVSSEADQTLNVVDLSTLEVVKRIPVTGRPHNVAISGDGSRVYVAIISAPGALNVIDTESLENVKTIPNEGGVHNVYVTPDGGYVLAGSIGGRKMTVYDAATEEPVWSLFEEGVRPITFETNPDGSTKRLFVELSEFHGFAVVDFAERREVRRIELPEIPPEERATGTFNGAPAHGIGVAPNGETLWVCSRLNRHVYAYSLPDLEFIGGVRVGDDPDWLTFTPDSQSVYVANAESDEVSVIDVQSLEEVARIVVGAAPKRNIAVEIPEDVGSGQVDSEGATLLANACTSCHDLGGITDSPGVYTEPAFRDLVVTMVGYGAPLSDLQVDTLVQYLTETYGSPRQE